MYPKQQLLSFQKENLSSRGELKSVLFTKYQKIYKNINKQELHNFVNNYINNQSKISSEVLSQLEHQMKEMASPNIKLVKSQSPNKNEVNIQNNLHVVQTQQNTSNEPYHYLQKSRTNPHKQLDVQHNNDLENQSFHQRSIQNIPKKNSLKQYLEKQIQEKYQIRRQQRQEEQYDGDLIKHNTNQSLNEEKLKKQINLEKINETKFLRNSQILSNKLKRKYQTELENDMDQQFLQKARLDLKLEEEANKEKIRYKTQISKRNIFENQQKIQNLVQIQQKEKQDDILKMKEYCKLLDEQEKQRYLAARQKEKRIQLLIEQYSNNPVINQHKENEKQLEEKISKWIIEQDKKQQKLEISQKKQKIKSKILIKNYLEEQINEKKMHNQQEWKNLEKLGYDIRNDTKLFYESERNKYHKIKETIIQNKEFILKQIKEKKSLVKQENL